MQNLQKEIDRALDMHRRGDTAGARRLCRQILAQAPRHGAALHLAGVLAYHQNDLAEAEAFLDQALILDSASPGLQNDLGLVYLGQRNFRDAADLFKSALRQTPHRPAYHLNAGLAFQGMGDVAAARQSFQTALVHRPDYPKALFLLGKLLQEQGETIEAAALFEKALALDKTYTAARNHLALCLHAQGRVEAALEQLKQALALDPHSAETCCNLGNLHRSALELNQAETCYRQALAMQPDFAEAHFNLALVLLLRGAFAQGWAEYQWRLQQFPPNSGYPRRHGLPLWQGQDLAAKTILVYDEQGFGDVFMFCRYLSLLQHAGARVVCETRPALFSLMRRQNLAHEWVPRSPSTMPRSVCDYCAPLCSLPLHFNTDLDTIPDAVPYVQADPRQVLAWGRRLQDDRPKIGLVWSGSDVDPSRRCPLSEFAFLSQYDQAAWYGLQKEAGAAPGENASWITNLGPLLGDFSDTAAVLANLDLLITIDTAAAHLAGAMGRPVWVLLPRVPDWRWFLEREDSPWYPSMRLLRQTRAGRWHEPLSRLHALLSAWFGTQEDG